MKYRFLSLFLLITISWYALSFQAANAGGVIDAFVSFNNFIIRLSVVMLNVTMAVFEITTLGIGQNHFFDSGVCRFRNLDEISGFGSLSDDCTKDFATILNGPGTDKICSNALPVYFFNAPPVTGDEADYNVVIYRFETPATTGGEALAYWFDGVKNQLGSGLYNGKTGSPKSMDVVTNVSSGFFTNNYNNPTALAVAPLATFLYKDFCTAQGVCRFIDNTAPLDSYVAYAAKLERNYSAKHANIIWYPITVRSNGTAYISYNNGQIDVLDLGNGNYYLNHNGRRYADVRSDIDGTVPHLAIPDGELRGINVYYPYTTQKGVPVIAYNGGYIKLGVNATTYSVTCGSKNYTNAISSGGLYIPLGALEGCSVIEYEFYTRDERVNYTPPRGASYIRQEVTLKPMNYNDGALIPTGVTITSGFGRNAVTTVNPPFTLINKGQTITATSGTPYCTNYQPARGGWRSAPPPPVAGVTPEIPAPCTVISGYRTGTTYNYTTKYQDYKFSLPENFLDGYDIKYRGPGSAFRTGNSWAFSFPVWLNYNGGKLLFDDVRIFDLPAASFYHTHYGGEIVPNSWEGSPWAWPLGSCDSPYTGMVCVTLKSNENPPTQAFSGKFLSTKPNESAVFPQLARGLHEECVSTIRGKKCKDFWVTFFDPKSTAVAGPYQTDPTLTCPPDTSAVVTNAQCTGVDLAVTVGDTTTSYDVLRNGQTIASDVPASQRSFHDGNTEPHMTYAYIIRAHTGTTTDDSAPATAYTKCLPTCTFKADPAKVIEHQASRLIWSCQEATACAITGGLTDIGPVLATGGTKSVTANDKGTYNYTLTCQNVDGSVTLPSVVNVTKPGLQEIKP